MSETTSRGITGALIDLGLESKFLSSDSFYSLPVSQRAEIANSILNQYIASNDWQEAVEMAYGEQGAAKPYLEGDKTQLSQSILESAVRSNTKFLHGDTRSS